MPAILSLPDEVLIKIFRYAIPLRTIIANSGLAFRFYHSDTTTASLCLVSKLFRELSQPLLYRAIIIYSDSSAELLLKSEGFERCRTVDLEVVGGTPSFAGGGVQHNTARNLVQSSQCWGLKVLRLRNIWRFDLRALQFTASCLENLTLELIWPAEPLGEWTFPAELAHFNLGGTLFDHTFLSPIITSSMSSIRSLSLGSAHWSTTESNIFSLPDFSSFAANVAFLNLTFRQGDTDSSSVGRKFTHFNSITHLSLENTDFDTISILMKSLPSETPTITNLRLALSRNSPYLNSDEILAWKSFIRRMRVLKKLAEITWVVTWQNPADLGTSETLEILRAGRDVRMVLETPS
ncbi:hypothetical protein P7C70_g1506, partial [Phenoliferia sp. Uapishka_3]